MNIFKKALIVALSIGLISVPTVTKEVSANTTDDSKETWSAIGTINGTSWNTDFDLAYDSVDDRYELAIALNANEEFKIRLNHSWSKSIGYGGNTGAGISTYLSNSGGNFKVKTTGNYILWVKDDKVANYGDNSYGFGIEKVTAKYYNIVHYDKDGAELSSESVIENSTYNPKFAEVEGYMLEGWYSDAGLTQKVEKGTKITSDLNLYPKYIECSDYYVYFDDNNTLGETVYVYMYRDSTDGANNGNWPGVAAEKDSSGLWRFQVDASKTYSKIIFNGGEGKEQTANLELSYKNTIYTISEKDNESKYTASTTLLDTVTAQLGVNYTYDSETNELNEVTSASLRFAAGEETNEITKPTYTVTSYGMTIAFGGAAKDVVWTSEEIVENDGKISWSGVVTNIPASYFNVKVTVECFVMIGETKVVVSNSREVTIASLANEYVEKAEELELEPVQKEACQYIVDSVAA